MTLSTHVLDTAHGRPAAGVAVTLTDSGGAVLFAGATDGDGRVILPAVGRGRYRLSFAVAAYFRAAGVALSDPPFLDVVTLDFAVGDGDHTHVPLLVAPFGYTTYRGS